MTGRPSASSVPSVGTTPAMDAAALLTLHQRWLRTVIYLRVRELAGIDEVWQETAATAVRSLATLRDPTRAGPWLYQLAVRQSLLYRRRAGRRRRLTQRYAERQETNDAERGELDPLAWLLADEQRRLVREAVARLPRRDAEILLLKYAEDWSCLELAARLGIGRSAVEARLHRARARLRSELAALDVASTAL